MMPNSEALRCLRDQGFKKHEYHAGHLTKMPPMDPRKAYEIRKKKKSAGRRAWLLVDMAENDKWGPRIALTPLQRDVLVRYVRDEILLAQNG